MEPYLGEIRLFAWPSAPKDWALCDGAVLSVREHQGLFSLLGNKYGGDGKKTFCLPDLRGRSVVGAILRTPASLADGLTSYAVGARAGADEVSLTVQEMPAHSHATNVSDKAGAFPLPRDSLLAVVGKSGANPTAQIYAEGAAATVELAANSISRMGGGAGHENMQPFAVLSYCIAMRGDYPPKQDAD